FRPGELSACNLLHKSLNQNYGPGSVHAESIVRFSPCMKKSASPVSMLAATDTLPSHPSAPATPKNGKKSADPVPQSPRTSGANLGLKQRSTGELDAEQILLVLTALKKGDFSVRLPVTWTGTPGRVADAFNDVAELLCLNTEV